MTPWTAACQASLSFPISGSLLRFMSVESATAAAKSLQSWPTLCDPIDGSPTGSPVPGILQARTLEWVAISFSNAWKWKVKVKVKSHSCVQLLAIPWIAAYQAPMSMGFARQEYWSGVPFNGILISHKKNEVMLFAATRMGLETTILHEMSDRKTNIQHHKCRL